MKALMVVNHELDLPRYSPQSFTRGVREVVAVKRVVGGGPRKAAAYVWVRGASLIVTS